MPDLGAAMENQNAVGLLVDADAADLAEACVCVVVPVGDVGVFLEMKIFG